MCGNAYEEIAIVPNFAFGDASAAMTAFRQLFHTTNPVFFYAPIGPLSIAAASTVAWTLRSDSRRRRCAFGVGGCVAGAVLLSVYIVARLNVRLFFGPVLEDARVARALGREWLVLNAVRMGLVAMAMTLVRRFRRI